MCFRSHPTIRRLLPEPQAATPSLVPPVFRLCVFARHSRLLQPTAFASPTSAAFRLATASRQLRLRLASLAPPASPSPRIVQHLSRVLVRSGWWPLFLKNYLRTYLLGHSDPATYRQGTDGIVSMTKRKALS